MFKRLALLIIFFVALLLMTTGCAWLEDLLNPAKPASDKYLFIETWT